MMPSPPPSPRQLLTSSKPCSDAVSESPSTPFPPFLIVIIIPPALIIPSDPEIIIIPSSIIYSCGHQRARTFPLPHPNRVSNRDHYGHPPHYRSDKFSTVEIFSLNPLSNDPSIIYEDPSIENPLCSRDFW
jgi:hypothetical protein